MLLLQGFTVGDTGFESCLEWSPDERGIAVGWEQRGISVWSHSGTLALECVYAVCYSVRGKFFLILVVLLCKITICRLSFDVFIEAVRALTTSNTQQMVAVEPLQP